MIPEKEREALMRLTMCAREECSVCKYQGKCNFDFQCELATESMNILADALRKTENSSEKPNNSTKATISKMEQVDKDINVRSKDCTTCKHAGEVYEDPCELCYRHSHYEPKDEPQTEDADCDKCIWSVCNYNKAFAFEDEPQTD